MGCFCHNQHRQEHWQSAGSRSALLACLLGGDKASLVGGVVWVDEGVGFATISTGGNTGNLLGVGVSRGKLGSIGVVLEVPVGWVIWVDERVPVRVGSLCGLDIVVVLIVVVVLVVRRSSLLYWGWCWFTIVRIMRS